MELSEHISLHLYCIIEHGNYFHVSYHLCYIEVPEVPFSCWIEGLGNFLIILHLCCIEEHGNYRVPLHLGSLHLSCI